MAIVNTLNITLFSWTFIGIKIVYEKYFVIYFFINK